MLCFFNGTGNVYGTMKSNDYIDIINHNLQDSAENVFRDAMIPFLFQHDGASVHTGPNI